MTLIDLLDNNEIRIKHLFIDNLNDHPEHIKVLQNNILNEYFKLLEMNRDNNEFCDLSLGEICKTSEENEWQCHIIMDLIMKLIKYRFPDMFSNVNPVFDPDVLNIIDNSDSEYDSECDSECDTECDSEYDSECDSEYDYTIDDIFRLFNNKYVKIKQCICNECIDAILNDIHLLYDSSENIEYIHKLYNYGECIVCFDQYHGVDSKELQCGHIFHDDCIYKLEHKLCPLCRHEI
jgi:hypothetical protein